MFKNTFFSLKVWKCQVIFSLNAFDLTSSESLFSFLLLPTSACALSDSTLSPLPLQKISGASKEVIEGFSFNSKFLPTFILQFLPIYSCANIFLSSNIYSPSVVSKSSLKAIILLGKIENPCSFI